MPASIRSRSSDIQKIIFHLRDRGIGVLITDHNVRETLRITDRAYIVHGGVIFKSGTPDSLAADEEVGGFIWGPSSGWTEWPGNCIRWFLTRQRVLHGDPAQTPHAARSEADSDAVLAAGHQAAADVDARAGGAAESGDGRKPAARRGADRGTAAARSRRRRPRAAEPEKKTKKTDKWDDADYEYFFGEYLDDGYRPRRRMEVRELPPIENTLSTREFAVRSPDVAARHADRRCRSMRDIGAAIIGNLDDDGYLVASFEELAAMGPGP